MSSLFCLKTVYQCTRYSVQPSGAFASLWTEYYKFVRPSVPVVCTHKKNWRTAERNFMCILTSASYIKIC